MIKRIIAFVLCFVTILFCVVVSASANVLDMLSYNVCYLSDLIGNATYHIGTDGVYIEGSGDWSTVDWWNALVHGGSSFENSYDTYVSSLPSTTVSFSDTAFSPALYFNPELSDDLDDLGCSELDITGNSVSFFTGSQTRRGTGGPSYWQYSTVFTSAPFSVSESSYYIFDGGAGYTNSYSSVGDFSSIQMSSDGGNTWTTVVSASSTKSYSSDTSLDTLSIDWTTVSVYLDASNLYRVALKLYVNLRNSSSSFYDHVLVNSTILLLPSIYRNGHTVLPSSTRLASLMQTINTYNSYDYSTKYYIGSTDSGGNVTNVWDPNLFDEQTMIFTEPVTGEQYQCTGWTYGYSPSVRGYRLELPESTYVYNNIDIRTLCLFYLDDALYVCGLDTPVEDQDFDNTADYFTNAIFIQEYNYVIATERESDVCQHVYTSETITEPTCLVSGVRRYTCELCGHTRDEYIPATGHAWEVTETVETEVSESGDITKLGYTVYTCSACGETYKQYDGTGQPGPPSGGDSSEDESWFSWLGNLFRSLISAIVNGLAAGLEYLVENVIVTVTDLIIQTVQWVMDLLSIDNLTGFFGWFSDDNVTFRNEFGPAEEVDVWAYSLD